MSTDPATTGEQAAAAASTLPASLPAWFATIPPWAWPFLVIGGFAGGGGLGQAMGLINQEQVEEIVRKEIQASEGRQTSARQAELQAMESRLGVTIREAILDERDRRAESP